MKNVSYNSKNNVPVQAELPHVHRERPFSFRLEDITDEDWRMVNTPKDDPYGVIEFIESGGDSQKVVLDPQVCPAIFYQKAYGWAYNHRMYGIVHHRGDFVYYTNPRIEPKSVKQEVW